MADKSHVQRSANSVRKRKRSSKFTGVSGTSSPSTVASQAPRGINVREFAEARAQELKYMVTSIAGADTWGKKRVIQVLPKHMRRRAGSHDVKRMPVRLRERAMKEMEQTDAKGKSKRKSRRQRRKPQNLLEEYNRRKRQHIWLETHIWHAKRMKMVNMWEYRLPEHPCDKGFKAAHRAMSQNCLLQDISYHCCTEISGQEQDIISAMSHITSKDLGPTMASKQFLGKSYEGKLILYKLGQYPYHSIGPVSFMWKPVTQSKAQEPPGMTSQQCDSHLEKRAPSICISSDDPRTATQNLQHVSSENGNLYITSEGDKDRNTSLTGKDTLLTATSYSEDILLQNRTKTKSVLWIWSHPACFGEVFEVITRACELVSKTVIRKEAQLGSSQLDEIDNAVVKEEDVNLNNNIEGRVLIISSLRFDLVRFRLTGPLSHALLVNTLEPVHEVNKNQADVATKVVDNSVPLSASAVEVWDSIKGVSSPAVLPPGSIIGLTVVDPRLGLPGIKTSTMYNATEQHIEDVSSSLSMPPELSDWPALTANSPIWDADVRHQVKVSKIPEQEMNNMRSKLLVPGTRLDLGDKTSHVPVLLVQQPGAKESGYGSGWDIILPSGWSMAFWMALVYRGARVGGLREARNSALECEHPYFPHDYPDTTAGLECNRDIEKDGREKYQRYPPAKRPNYDKLGMLSPFSQPWKKLVSEWSTRGSPVDLVVESESHGMPVVSSLERESLVNSCIDSDIVSSTVKNEVQVKLEADKDDDTSIGADNDVLYDNKVVTESSDGRSFYVLRTKKKLDQLREIINNKLNKRKAKKLVCQDDVIRSTLNDIVGDAQSSLVCVSLRMVNRGYPLPNATVSIPSESDLEALRISRSYGGPLEPLHKGNKATGFIENSLINSCTREVIGFVTSGGMSLSHGCGMGIGYCALPGLVKLMSRTDPKRKVMVLVRNANSQQYRLACLRVL